MAKKLTVGSLEVEIYNTSIDFIEEVIEYSSSIPGRNFYVEMHTSEFFNSTIIKVKNANDSYHGMIKIEDD